MTDGRTDQPSTELIKCNNIWSYICYRIPPSVVALKVSYGSVINFFKILKFFLKILIIWKIEKFWRIQNFRKIQKVHDGIFLNISKKLIFKNICTFQKILNFLNFSKFLKISKKLIICEHWADKMQQHLKLYSL